MLQAGILPLGVFTDDAKINILVSCIISGDVLDQGHRRIDIQLLTQSDIEGLMTSALNRSEEDTLQSYLVSLQRSDRLLEQILRVFGAISDSGDVDLLPFDRYVIRLEDRLDGLSNLCADTIT